MMIQERTQPAFENFLRFSKEAKIIMLHPESRYRSLVVALLLSDAKIPTFYYALDVDDVNLTNMLNGLLHSLPNQHPTFGRLLNILPTNVLVDPYQHLDLVLETFIDELSELSDDEFYLVLDEFDRADAADDVHRFVERLSHFAPARCTIVLNGRTLPRLPWLSMIARRDALILRDDVLVRENMYGNQNTEAAGLKVLSLGPGYVFIDDLLIDDWEGHLPRLLLFFSMDRPEVTRNLICETFWPKLDIDQAVNVFHVTKRRLHKALGMDILSHDGTYYRADSNISLYFDAVEFVEALLEGRYGAPDDPFELWQKVAKLYRGPFLQGHEEDWISERRDAYRAAYLEALNNIADLWIADEKYELALHTLSRAIDTDYSAEDIHLKLLKLYVRLGRRAEAVAHYRELEQWSKANRAALGAPVRQLFSDITA